MEVPWGALVPLLIWVVAMTIGGVVWATTVTVTLDFMKKTMEDLNRANTLYATKVELASHIAIIRAQVEKQWEKIDKMQEEIK